MSRNGFLTYVHSFRGFAILNIVAIHSFAFAQLIPADWNLDRTSLFYILNETLFHDSTIYFALISGLLFSAILSRRGYRHFYTNKLRYVVAPYVFCSLVFSLQGWNLEGPGIIRGPDSLDAYLYSIGPNLVWGEAQFTYWYIPVLLLMFALTPLLNRLTQARSFAAIPVWLVMLAPLVFSRPDFDPDGHQLALGTLIYFSGAYTVGIYLGQNLESRLAALSRHRGGLLMLAAVSSVAIALLMYREIGRVGGVDLQESLFYLQKLSMAGLVLVWLHDLGSRQPRFLTLFANEAFSIYFLHAFFLALLGHFLWEQIRDPEWLPGSMYLMGFVYFVFSLLMSMLVVALLRWVFGKWSRILIGS